MNKELKSHSKVEMKDVDAAKEKKDYAALEALCLQQKRRCPLQVRNAACTSAVELATAAGNVAKLAEICKGKGKYRPWRKNRQACKAKGAADAATSNEALKTASCATLVAAWEKSKSTVTNKYNTTLEARNEAFQSTAVRLIKCGKWDYVWEKMVHWGGSSKSLGPSLLRGLDSKGYDLEKEMFAYIKRHHSGLFAFEHAGYTLSHYFDFLNKKKAYQHCKKYIPYADKVSDKVFGNFNWFFRQSNCSGVVKILKKRMLSNRHATRGGACTTLAKFGTKKHIKKLKILANTDPYH